MAKKHRKRLEGPHDTPDNELNRAREQAGLPPLTNQDLDPAWVQGKRPVIFSGEQVSWVESKQTKGAALRARSWATREEREAYRERLERFGKFVRDRVANEEEAAAIVLDLTNPSRGSGARLCDASAVFLARHLNELTEGLAEGAPLRAQASHLQDRWEIRVSLRSLFLIIRNT